MVRVRKRERDGQRYILLRGIFFRLLFTGIHHYNSGLIFEPWPTRPHKFELHVEVMTRSVESEGAVGLSVTPPPTSRFHRTEEHTSELQSR